MKKRAAKLSGIFPRFSRHSFRNPQEHTISEFVKSLNTELSTEQTGQIELMYQALLEIATHRAFFDGEKKLVKIAKTALEQLPKIAAEEAKLPPSEDHRL